MAGFISRVKARLRLRRRRKSLVAATPPSTPQPERAQVRRLSGQYMDYNPPERIHAWTENPIPQEQTVVNDLSSTDDQSSVYDQRPIDDLSSTDDQSSVYDQRPVDDLSSTDDQSSVYDQCPVDDESPVEDLNSVDAIDCGICDRPIAASDAGVPGACLDCTQHWIRLQIETNGCQPIRCPAPRCSHALDYQSIQTLADPATFQRYDSLLLRAALSRDRNFVHCPVPNCGTGQIHETGDEEPIVTCSRCGFRYCFRHPVAWHEGQSCEQYDSRQSEPRSEVDQTDSEVVEIYAGPSQGGTYTPPRAQRATQSRRADGVKKLQEKKSLAYIERISKKCPKCAANIEKNGGCSHMTCTRCGMEFCWFCLRPGRGPQDSHWCTGP